MRQPPKDSPLAQVAWRIHELREILGYSVSDMAKKTEVPPEIYLNYEAGTVDLPFSFIHKCALAFNVTLTELLEGQSAKLTSYTVTRRDQGRLTVEEEGISIKNMAPLFKNKLAEPYWVRYQYEEHLQHAPIHTVTHAGQEFDLVLEGTLRVKVGEHEEVLEAGDSIFYNSSTPHGMIAIGGKECLFLAMVISSDEKEKLIIDRTHSHPRAAENLLCKKFITPMEDGNGRLHSLTFHNEEKFNFAFDIVDGIATQFPDKLAMLHLTRDKKERRFTFAQMKRYSAQTANYFKSLGIKKGDRVMLVLKRHYQFWFAILALHKLGAIAIPATNLLQEHDFAYRFQSAGVTALVCTLDGDTAHQAELAAATCPNVKTLISVGGKRPGWHDFDDEFELFSGKFERTEHSPCGDDPMLMFFTSGTTGYPKIATHNYRYALGHFVTAKYWHGAMRDGIHFTISDTGWGKALWGKLYGQWMCEGAVFTYDFDRFDAGEIMPLFAKYGITTFCAPPTMYRMLIKEDLDKYDWSSLKRATTAGEALNPEVFKQFKKSTGLSLYEGFGQTETTLTIAQLMGDELRQGSMGKPICSYGITLMDNDGNEVPNGETGEIVIRTDEHTPCGLFQGYYLDKEKTDEVWADGIYHTGDLAWCDEDGYYYYVGRKDDVIKSSGYRIGPFEIESVIMELPYVLECGVSAVPDDLRGQVVKASIVLTNGTQATEILKKEIQTYVKTHTAPYKYPRIVVFCDALPKTISGKIQRNKL